MLASDAWGNEPVYSLAVRNPPAITEELAEFLESGDVAIWVATANAECVPQTTRSFGAHVDRARGLMWLFVLNVQGARVLANTRSGGLAAATFVRIYDYRAVQAKGEITSTHACNDDERRRIERYWNEFADANARVGMQRELILRHVYWPCTAVEISVRELFAQTPGPNAGAPL